MAKIKEYVLAYWQYGALAFLALTAAIVWLTAARKPAESTVSVADSSVYTSSSSAVSGSTSANSKPSSGYVYVSGAVKHPGLYHVGPTTRWADVVQAAGGLTKDANPGQVNLAQIAHDEENMAVPVRGETVATVAPVSGSGQTTAAGGASASGSSNQINLNTATVTDLQTISGIGPKRAQDIIDYRDQHGGFKTVDELKEISGIGDKIFADLAPSVTVGP